MNWLSDRAIERLRDAAAWPELDARYVITGVAGRGSERRLTELVRVTGLGSAGDYALSAAGDQS